MLYDATRPQRVNIFVTKVTNVHCQAAKQATLMNSEQAISHVHQILFQQLNSLINLQVHE